MDRDMTTMEPDFNRQVGKWVVAAIIACAALLGGFTLVAAVVVFVELPSWAEVVIGVAMALGAVGFAWLVASAIDSSRHDRSDRNVKRLPRR
jgi:hypothetical protein